MYRDFFWINEKDPADLRKLPFSKKTVGMISIMGSNGYFDYYLR